MSSSTPNFRDNSSVNDNNNNSDSNIIHHDSLLEIATFLAKSWSDTQDLMIEFSNNNETKTSLKEKKITIMPIHKYQGTSLEKYRQFRVALWHESMRIKHCQKIQSNDHAFGFILNTIETRRIQIQGKNTWQGMDTELIFSYAYALNYRPQLNALYGKARIVEAFYQAFLFNGIKGELQPSNIEKVQLATKHANQILQTAIQNNYQTDWIEKEIPQIIKILGIDPLLTIPVSLPWMKKSIPLTKKEIIQTVSKISKNLQPVDTDIILYGGTQIQKEYKMLLQQQQQAQTSTTTVSKKINTHNQIQIPIIQNADETKIYDQELINKLKIKFKRWKYSWKEQSHQAAGDEFDEEAYIEENTKNTFLTDTKSSIKTKMIILLDHSSSIANQQIQYKKTTLALCQVLSYLKINFAVYAFNTQNRSVVCWLVKQSDTKWTNTSSKRLAQIAANGSTPLGSVYNKMADTIISTSATKTAAATTTIAKPNPRKPKIFLTLTDGEPSDPAIVKTAIKSFKTAGIKMVALGLGPDSIQSTIIAQNLKTLGYEKTLAVSRLHDIPNRVLDILQQ